MAKQNWKKLGLLFDVDGKKPWAKTHAAVPVAVPLDKERYRVFVSTRDGEGRSHVGHFELDLGGHKAEAGPLSPSPVLSPGPLGCFDDRGTMLTWIVNEPGQQYHYYIGWNLGLTVPFYVNLGLAISEDGGFTVRRNSEGPMLGRSSLDPILVASCCVLPMGRTWRMWYLSGTRWAMDADKPKHYYNIRYAESADGIHWTPTGKVCIDYKDETEYAISRPSVLYEKGLYRMWFSHRGESYRIGYAESRDGILWDRRDEEVGLGVSASGWDSEMIEYPFVFRRGESLYMLYNGNGFGRTGVGLAVLERD